MNKQEAIAILHAIHQAIEWLLGLTDEEVVQIDTPQKKSLRVFTEIECKQLSLSARSLLLMLEQQDILNPILREKIIHHAMELKVEKVDSETILGIARILLSYDEEIDNEALTRMNLLILQNQYTLANIH